jgi:hypothetical protein
VGLLIPAELAAQQGPSTANEAWYKVATGIIAIPTALLAILISWNMIRKTRLETKKLELDIRKQTEEAKESANEASDRADLATAQAEKANQGAEDARAKLDRFIFLAMPKPIYANLFKLAQPEPFGRYRINEGFKAQLRFLRDAGYITLDRSVGQLQDGDDLSAHAQVTELGREFIANRRRLVPDEQL